ncbi:uncharacterized protein [Amphiura filiformis]|uniref:uncharacterized protein n=1 Tax=Amphiura filiformis TaxID=82378 RepID=UPI003B225D62
MGSPVSPIVATVYMEWLEQGALVTARLDIKPKLWKRYVDDVLEIVNKGPAEPLTEHLNLIGKTGNMKFTYETEENKQIPFFETLIVKKLNGFIKLLVYRHIQMNICISNHTTFCAPADHVAEDNHVIG